MQNLVCAQGVEVNDGAAEGATETIGPRQVADPSSGRGKSASASDGGVSWGLLGVRPSLGLGECCDCGDRGHTQGEAVAV